MHYLAPGHQNAEIRDCSLRPLLKALRNERLVRSIAIVILAILCRAGSADHTVGNSIVRHPVIAFATAASSTIVERFGGNADQRNMDMGVHRAQDSSVEP